MEQVKDHRWKDVKPEHHAFHHANEAALLENHFANARRYCEVEDNNGHRYIVPADKQEEWYHWVDAEDHDNQPEWAVRADGVIVTFVDPRIE